jgi:hypothetical protein
MLNYHKYRPNQDIYNGDQQKEFNYQRISSKEIDDFIEQVNRQFNLDDISDSDPYFNSEKELRDLSFIYVVSNKVYREKNMFKIGKHTGTQKMLEKRYKTYLIDVDILFFFPTGSATEDESYLLQKFSNYRVMDSEFLKIPLDKLMDDITRYFKLKYQRVCSVKMPYPYGYWNQIVYDFLDKKINQEECWFQENLNGSLTIRNKQGKFLKQIPNISSNDVWQGDEMSWKEFFKCFMVEFYNPSKILYLDKFIENGWNDFLIYCMKKLYSFHGYKEMTRKEFLQKEKFTERIIFIRYCPISIDLVIEKANFVSCCLVIEDKNFYTLPNTDLFNYSFEDIIHFLFYTF